ncbi:MAG: threonine ammonia-lyase [Acidobacteriota bacterium]
MTTQASTAVDLAAIRAARERVRDVLVRTPLRRSRGFSKRTDAAVYFKYETLQVTGSFKVRGAVNKLRLLDDETRARGVIASSAGNHAQGVAFGAADLDMPATIVMPEDTPHVKIMRTEAYGDRIRAVLHGESYDDAYTRAREIQAEEGQTFIHAFDDDDVINGQGTIGLELLDDLPDLEAVVVPIGGGGLIAGIATAVTEINPAIKVYGVQSESVPSMYRSFQEGMLMEPVARPSIADGIAVKRPAQRTLDIIRRRVEDIVLISEAAIESAVVALLENGKTVVEGAGGAGVAAITASETLRAAIRGRRTAVILCGGNIDLNRLNLLIERALARRGQVLRLRTVLVDRPGALAALLNSIAEQKGNVLRVFHDRVYGPRMGRTEVVLTVGVRNREHGDRLLHAMRRAHPEVVELPSGSPGVTPHP